MIKKTLSIICLLVLLSSCSQKKQNLDLIPSISEWVDKYGEDIVCGEILVNASNDLDTNFQESEEKSYIYELLRENREPLEYLIESGDTTDSRFDSLKFKVDSLENVYSNIEDEFIGFIQLVEISCSDENKTLLFKLSKDKKIDEVHINNDKGSWEELVWK